MAITTKNLTCIVCPRGCTLTVTLDSALENPVVSVEGQGCKRGVDYATAECTHLTRVLTTTAPTVDGGVVAAFEIMLVDHAIANMIREGKVHQMDNVIYAGAAQGMFTMDGEIMKLYKAGRISKENALLHSTNRELMAKKLM